MAGPVSDWLAGTTVGPQPTPEDNVAPFKKSSPVQDWLEGPDHAPAIEQSLGASPDEEARKRKLSEQSGLSYDAVDADPKEVEKLVRKQQIDNLVKDAPITREWLADPLNASVAHDDVESLAQIEDTWTTSNVFTGMSEAAQRSLAGIGDFALSLAQDLEKNPNRQLGPIEQYIKDTFTDWSKLNDKPGQYVPSLTFEEMNTDLTNWLNPLKLIQYGGERALTSIPSMVEAVVSPGTFMMGLTGDIAEGRAQNDGRSQATTEDMLKALPAAVISAQLERLGAIKLFKGNPFKGIFGEGFTEAGQSLVEYTGETAGTEKGFDAPTAAMQTLQGFVDGILAAGVQRGAVDTYIKAVDKLRQTTTAKVFKQRLDKTQETLANSALAPRDPAAAMDHFSKVGPKTTYLSVDGITELANKLELSPVDLAQQLGIRSQFEKEYLRGGDIQLSADQLGQLMLNEEWSLLSEHIRETEDSFTLREAEEFEKTGLKEEIDTALAEETIVSAGIKIGDRVYTGASHAEILTSPELLDESNATEILTELNEGSDGFVTSSGRFVSREEAVRINERSGQRFTRAGDEPQRGAVAERIKTKEGGKLKGQGTIPLLTDLPIPEQEVIRVEQELGTDGIFKTAEEAGMTEQEYMFYLASLDRAHKAAVNRQNEKLLKDAQRKVSKEYKKLRKDMRESARESLANTPVYQAINSIQKEHLDRAAVAAILGDEKYLDQLPKQSKGRPIYTNKGEEGGLDPSIVAEMHGFDTASDMLLAMMTALPFDQAVEQTTDQMMQRQYPDLTNEKLRLDAALESLHNDATNEVLVQELNKLRELAAEKKTKKAEKPAKEAKEKKPQTEAQKKAVEVRKLKLNVLKNAIKRQLNNTPIKDVRVSRFVKTAKEQGKLAGKLLRKGDVEGAINAKFKQLTNFIMAQQAYKVKAETEKQNKKLNQLATRKRNKLPQSFYDMIRQTLSDYNIGPKISEKTRKRMQDFVARKTAEGAIFQIPPQLLSDQKKHWQDMTIAEWRDLVDAVKNIEAQGRLQKQSTALHGKVEFEHERAVLLKQAENIPDTARAKRAEKSAVKTYKDKVAAGIAAFDAAIVKMENLLRELDGKAVGPWWEAFYKRFSRAETEKLDMMEKHVRPIIQDAFKQLPKKVLSRMNKKVFVPSLGKEYTYSQLLKIALNMGNPSNISKMLDGHNEHERGKTWTQQDLIDAMALLSPEEARWVQGVWDQLESFRPAVERVYEAEMGIAAERIPIQPVVIGGVKVKGGYFPMQYAQTPTFSTPLEAMQDPLIRAGIFSGMTKERTKFSAPIDLDLNGMINALEQQIHFITHYEAVRNVNKLLNDKEITRIIRDKLGEEYLNEFKSWYSAVASGGMKPGSNDPIDIGTEIFRTNMTAAALGGNLITIGSQVLGAFSSISQMAKPIKGDKGYSSWRGMSAFAKGGWIYATKKNAVKDATALSGVIRHRIASQDRDMRENMNKLKGKTDLKSRWNRMMMLTISGMQLYSVDIPTWIGAYNLGLKDGLSVEKAIDYADNILTTSQGSGHIKDLSALQRERGLKRALTMFSTWTFIQYNLQRDIVKSAKKFPVDAFAKSVWITLAPAVLAAWMRGNFGPDDEEDETWAGWLAQVFLGYNLGSVPVVGQWIGAVSQGYDFSFTPIQRIPDSLEKMLESVSKIFDEDEELDYKDISNIVKGTGYTLGIGGTTTAGRMFDALNKAEEEDVDWWEYITGPSRK